MARYPQTASDLWDDVAYMGRYGHQPASAALAMTRSARRAFIEATSAIVDAEQKASGAGGEG